MFEVILQNILNIISVNNNILNVIPQKGFGEGSGTQLYPYVVKVERLFPKYPRLK